MGAGSEGLPRVGRCGVLCCCLRSLMSPPIRKESLNVLPTNCFRNAGSSVILCSLCSKTRTARSFPSGSTAIPFSVFPFVPMGSTKRTAPFATVSPLFSSFPLATESVPAMSFFLIFPLGSSLGKWDSMALMASGFSEYFRATNFAPGIRASNFFAGQEISCPFAASAITIDATVPNATRIPVSGFNRVLPYGQRSTVRRRGWLSSCRFRRDGVRDREASRCRGCPLRSRRRRSVPAKDSPYASVAENGTLVCLTPPMRSRLPQPTKESHRSSVWLFVFVRKFSCEGKITFP